MMCQAESLCKDVIKMNHRNIDAYNLLAGMCLHQENPAKALA